MRATIRKPWLLKIGYVAFLLSLFFRAVLHVQGNAWHFVEGLLTGLAIVLLLVGTYRARHTPTQA